VLLYILPAAIGTAAINDDVFVIREGLFEYRLHGFLQTGKVVEIDGYNGEEGHEYLATFY